MGLRTRNSAAYKGLYALLMREGGQDFRTGDPIDLQTYFDDNIDIHHIFPRKVCNDSGIPPKVYNSIVNKTPLAARTNRTIGGNLPSVYLDRLQRNGNMSELQMDAILCSHLIDPISLRADDFESFFRARQDTLLSLIERATGKTILRTDMRGEVEETDEDDDLEVDFLEA